MSIPNAHVIIGFGSNLGDRAANINNSANDLARYFEDVICSSLYDSEALLPENAPATWNIKFLNAVISGHTWLSAYDLLAKIKEIEVKYGRNIHSERWSPRSIDIDILTYGKKCINTDELNIPHKFIAERVFVLKPIAEILPEWVHPIKNLTAIQMLSNFTSEQIDLVEKTSMKFEI